MVKRYYGGVISATQAVVNTSSATGFFNITQQMQAAQAGTWPPPGLPENTAGWFGGGYTPPGVASTVQRITFATDTATSTTRGPLSLARPSLAATGNATDAWFGGGGQSPLFSRVDRITYATDTATASVRGPLSLVRKQFAAAGNETYGWFGGGVSDVNPEGPPYYFYYSTIDRITYATDTATASVRGPLSTSINFLAATGNTTDGWFGGSGYSTSTVQRITYATDTATASVRGPLSGGRYGLAAAGNSTDGWFGGGGNPAAPGAISTVDRITYATDTATASVRGPLSLVRYALAAAGNTTNGWFGGGATPAAASTVDRITYATDTVTASVRGPLGMTQQYHAAAGGIQ
jgi:hypothetical protein